MFYSLYKVNLLKKSKFNVRSSSFLFAKPSSSSTDPLPDLLQDASLAGAFMGEEQSVIVSSSVLNPSTSPKGLYDRRSSLSYINKTLDLLDHDGLDPNIKLFKSDVSENIVRRVGLIVSSQKVSFEPKEGGKVNGVSVYFTSGRYTYSENSRGLKMEKFFFNSTEDNLNALYDRFSTIPLRVVLEFEMTSKSLRLVNLYSFEEIIGGGSR